MKHITSILALSAVVALTGCTLDKPKGKILSVTTRGLYCTVAATDSTTGTPKVTLGLGSQTVTIIPTDTNTVYAAPVADTSSIHQTVNPFSTSGDESLAAGGYAAGVTNSIHQAPAVPK